MQGSDLPEAQTRHADPRETTGRGLRLEDAGLIMMTDPLTATARVADTDEVRIQVMEEELTATVREQFVFTRRV